MSDINDKIISGNFLTDITDHLPNFLLLGTPQKDVINQRPLIRVYNERNINKFRSDLAEIDWYSMFESKSPNEKCNIFISTYSELFESNFPKKKLSRKRAKEKYWVTPSLKKCIQRKNNLYQLKLEHPTQENIKEVQRI